MKKLLLTFTALGMLAGSALAGNSTVEDAIKSRDDLSHFYAALQATGVLNELKPDTVHAVFAPTNEAFDELYNDEKYPCFGHEACKDDFAEVLRNHFAPGFHDLSQENSLFAMNDRQLIIGHPHRGHDSVDGNMVEEVSQLVGSVLYKIDGVIMNKNEMAMFRHDPEPTVSRREPVSPSSMPFTASSPAR